MASGGLHSGASAPPPNVLLLWVALHNAIEAIDRAVENLQSYSRYLTNDQFEQTLEILEQNPGMRAFHICHKSWQLYMLDLQLFN